MRPPAHAIGLNLLLFAKAHQSRLPTNHSGTQWPLQYEGSTHSMLKTTCRVDACASAPSPFPVLPAPTRLLPQLLSSASGFPEFPQVPLNTGERPRRKPKDFGVGRKDFNNWVISCLTERRPGRGFGSESDWVQLLQKAFIHLVKTCAAAEVGRSPPHLFPGSSCPVIERIRTTIGLLAISGG